MIDRVVMTTVMRPALLKLKLLLLCKTQASQQLRICPIDASILREVTVASRCIRETVTCFRGMRLRDGRRCPWTACKRSWRSSATDSCAVTRGNAVETVDIGNTISHMLLIARQVCLLNTLLRWDQCARRTEQQRPSACSSQLGLFAQMLRQYVYWQGASQFRDVAIQVADIRRPADLVRDKDGLQCDIVSCRTRNRMTCSRQSCASASRLMVRVLILQHPRLHPRARRLR